MKKYKHIAVYGKYMGSLPWYIGMQQALALSMDAPINTIYIDGDKIHTFDEVKRSDAKDFFKQNGLY